jgi:hypothetical protein
MKEIHRVVRKFSKEFSYGDVKCCRNFEIIPRPAILKEKPTKRSIKQPEKPPGITINLLKDMKGSTAPI